MKKLSGFYKFVRDYGMINGKTLFRKGAVAFVFGCDGDDVDVRIKQRNYTLPRADFEISVKRMAMSEKK